MKQHYTFISDRVVKRAGLFCLAVIAGGLPACSAPEAPKEVYRIAQRQYGPPPVYSRLTWSHLPKPVTPKAQNEAPLVLPIIEFEMPDATLREAVEALAQSLGYRWHYPNRVASRKIQIRMEGTVEEILREISAQTGVYGEFDHERRLLTIVDDRMKPKLPG